MEALHQPSLFLRFADNIGALLVLILVVAVGASSFATMARANGKVTITATSRAAPSTVSRDFSGTVPPGNVLPQISAIPDQTIGISSVLAAVPFAVSDSESPAEKLSVTGSSSDAALVLNANIVFGGTGASRTVTVTPGPEKSGATTITISVTDESGGQATTSFHLNVLHARREPTLAPLPDLEINKDAPAQPVRLTGIGLGAFKAGQTLKVTAVSSNPALIPDPTVNYVSPDSIGTLSFAPAGRVDGRATITVTVDDGSAIDSTFSRSFVVTVLGPNLPPDVSAIPDQTVGVNNVLSAVPFHVDDPETPADQLSITGSSSDPTLVPNGNILFNGSGFSRTVTVIPAPNQVGSTTITIAVKDENGDRATVSFLLTVTPPGRAPTLDPLPDMLINEDAPVRLVSLTGIVPGGFKQGQILKVTAVSSNPTLVADPVVNYMSPDSSGTLSIAPLLNANGIAIITVTVDDGNPIDTTFSRSFSVTVFPVNDVPAISTILDQTIDENTIAVSIPFTVADVETPAIDLVASSFSADTALVPNANIGFVGTGVNRTLLIAPAPNRFGTTKLTINVTDSNGGVGASAFLLTVRPVNTPPVIITQPIGQSVMPGETATFTVEAAGSEPLSYQWRLNGNDIPGAREFKFVLSEVTVNNAGNYSVGVSNVTGSISSQIAILNVLAPPTINIQPRSQSVGTGSSLNLSVSTFGDGPFIYQWRLNGVNIPGATNVTFGLLNVQTGDAGTYSCAVANRYGAVNSATAPIIAQVDDLPMTDNFADRKKILAPTGTGRSPNLGATREPREPKHAGKVGGKSMWISWVAPSDGIAVFNTAGSTFDTLLGVYTGGDLGSLTTVTRDEDQGGYLTSGAQFNTIAGTEYQIAVDGFAGREGIIILSWNLELTREVLPEINTQPQSQTVGPGATVGFTVGARGPGLTYQWFFNDTVVPGATEPNYVISQVQTANVGSYRARVFRGTRFVDSATAILQLGKTADAEDLRGIAATDKFADAFAAAQVLPLALQSANPRASIRRTSGGLARGFTGTQNFSTVGSSKEEGEPLHCGEIGGASQWFSYQAPANGPLTITTDGSDFETVLAVYVGPGTDFASLQLVACDKNSGVDGKTSLVRFSATVGTTYFIAVDGVNAASGNVRLNYSVDVPFHLSAARIENGQFRLSLNAGVSGVYLIQGSTNLSNWFPIQTVQAPTGGTETIFAIGND
ncbi:MAG: immunoglobulin domain-containing protein, partial [Verrucomicrobiota bacterium]